MMENLGKFAFMLSVWAVGMLALYVVGSLLVEGMHAFSPGVYPGR